MSYGEQAYPTKKHQAGSRAAGSGQQLELGISGEEGNQEPTSASEHSQDMGRFSGSAQQSQKRQWGLSCLFVAWLQEEFKPHRHCTGPGDMAQSHDFTSTPGTAACERVITEGTVI